MNLFNNIISSLLGKNSSSNKKVEPIIKKKQVLAPSADNSPIERSYLSPEVISKKEHIPVFEKVISYPKSEIPLNEDLRRNYIVLLENSNKKTVIVICSAELTTKSKVDNTFLTIKNKCIGKGYSVKQIIAPRQIIHIVYENDEKARDGDSFDRDRKEGFISDFDLLISKALQEGVSDVHIELRRKDAKVRFRRHGELYTFAPWPLAYARDMSSVIYQVMADEKEPSFIESKSQAARIERNIGGYDLGIRLNTLPVSGGFDVVMRLLRLDDESEADRIIDTLGYSPENIVSIYRAMSRPTGLIIIAGTTGSGKSTSLSTMLNTIIREKWGDDGPKIKVITVEDPTEYTIIGASQNGVVRNRNKPDENPFAESMKAAMRCDPDILMVGEVRDSHSAKLLVGAVQSGHTAFTTVHAASAVGIIPRLKSFGVDSETLGSSDFISALIYQTLLPVVCPDCSISIDEFKDTALKNNDKKSLAVIKRVVSASEGEDISKVKFRDHHLAEKCSNPDCVNGVVGRTVVAEVITPNPLILSAFEMGSVNLAKYYHAKMGGKFIREHAVEKVLEGITDPRDAEDKVDFLDDKINISLLEQSLKLTEQEINSIESERRKSEGYDEDTQVSTVDSEKPKNHENHEKDKKERFQSKLLNDNVDKEDKKDGEIFQFSSDKLTKEDKKNILSDDSDSE